MSRHRIYPPEDLLKSEPRRIWDLGSHIGLAAMHYAVRYPAATITAVELESMNAALCRRNLASLDGRCEVIEAAVWDTDGRVELDLGPSSESATVTNAFRVITGTDLAEGRKTASVEAISLNSLLARAGESAVIDYCKMDIEGAERQVLRHGTDWAERVAVILVEVHPPNTAEECHTDLERLGFRLAPTMQHRQGVVIASRP